MLVERMIITHRNLIILKNYLLQNKTMLVKHLLLILIIGYYFLESLYNSSDGHKYDLLSLLFYFTLFVFSIGQYPLRFRQKADFIYFPDVSAYLKKMILHNLLLWPLIFTTIIAFLGLFFHNVNLLYIIFTMHAAFVWWFAGNILANLYFIKNTQPVNKKLIISFYVFYFVMILATIVFPSFDFFPKSFEIYSMKFIPLLGWLLELINGNTEYIYQMYFGFMFSVFAFVYFLYINIVQTVKPSVIREQLIGLIDQHSKAKENTNLLADWADKFKFLNKEFDVKGKFAATLHYKNLCANKKLGIVAYIDWISLIILVFGLAFSLMMSNHMKEFSKNAHRFPNVFYMGNSFLWYYLMARKEKSAQPDFYFALIPASPQQKLNQLIKFGLWKITITVLLVNLAFVPFVHTNPWSAVLFSLFAPALYLFKISISFIMSIYLQAPPNSSYSTIMKGLISVIFGLFIPGTIVSFLMFCFSITGIFTLISKIFTSISASEIASMSYYGLSLLFYLIIYALFYGFFDKIYRKIDFGKN